MPLNIKKTEEFNKGDEEDFKLHIYNLPFERCSCRDENDNFTRIARNYREFYDRFLSKKETAEEILNDMGIMRMCCRRRFANPPLDFMIDRSSDRWFDARERNTISYGTRELSAKNPPPDFPILSL
jgi:hypothetical protein